MIEYPTYITLGQDRPVLLFAHANAYHPGCYLSFLEGLTDHYTVVCPKHRPLIDPAFLNIKSWDLFTNDLIDFCDQHGFKKVAAIGHSLGAIALWKLKQKRPDLISYLHMIDPVILPAHFTWINKFLPYSFKKRYIPIVKIAANRRNKWSNREEASVHFSKISVFKKFEPKSFQYFIQYGLMKEEGGVTLSFPREAESRIYGSVENAWQLMDEYQENITILRADHSNVINRQTWQKIQTIMPKVKFVNVKDANHMLPLEHPEKLSQLILNNSK